MSALKRQVMFMLCCASMALAGDEGLESKVYKLSREEFRAMRVICHRGAPLVGPDTKELLQEYGIKFPEGGRALYAPSQSLLAVRSTSEEIEKVDSLVEKARATAQAGRAGSPK